MKNAPIALASSPGLGVTGQILTRLLAVPETTFAARASEVVRMRWIAGLAGRMRPTSPCLIAR